MAKKWQIYLISNGTKWPDNNSSGLWDVAHTRDDMDHAVVFANGRGESGAGRHDAQDRAHKGAHRWRINASK